MMLCPSFGSHFIKEVTPGGGSPSAIPTPSILVPRGCPRAGLAPQGLLALPKSCQPCRGFTSFMAK